MADVSVAAAEANSSGPHIASTGRSLLASLSHPLQTLLLRSRIHVATPVIQNSLSESQVDGVQVTVAIAMPYSFEQKQSGRPEEVNQMGPGELALGVYEDIWKKDFEYRVPLAGAVR